MAPVTAPFFMGAWIGVSPAKLVREPRCAHLMLPHGALAGDVQGAPVDIAKRHVGDARIGRMIAYLNYDFSCEIKFPE